MKLALLALMLTAEPVAPAPTGRYEDAQTVVAMSMQPGGKELQVTITIKTGFHLNDEYPINFQPDFGGPKVEKKQMGLTPCPADPKTHCAVKVTVPVIAEAAKAKTVGGLMAFAACDKDVCLIKKVPLSVRVGP